MSEKERPGAQGGAAGADRTAAATPDTTDPHGRASADLTLVIEALDRQHWRVSLLDTGEVVLPKAKQPLFAAARALLARGHDPARKLTMRRRPDGADAFVPMRLDFLARLAVEENDRGIRIRRWRDPALRPHRVGESGAVAAEGDVPGGDMPAGARGGVGEDAP